MSTSFLLGGGMRVRFAGLTDVGRQRTLNEDRLFLPVAERLAVVADGMGGHASGEVASKMAVEAVVEYLRSTEEEPEQTWPFHRPRGLRYQRDRLATAIKIANLRVCEAAQQEEHLRGMGTTIVVGLWTDGQVFFGHVGDSRVYRLRGDGIVQLTVDHSLLNDYLRIRRMEAEDAEDFPLKNVIVRALGMKESVQVDIAAEEPRVGDIHLLCTDGLTGMATDDEILRTVTSAGELDQACAALVQLANEHGGSDNITVLLARLEPA